MTDEDRGTAEDGSRIKGTIHEIERTPSGLWSWDRAVGFRSKHGTPDRGIIELYGDEHTGKTTLACYLVGRRSLEKELVFCDLEGSIDPWYLEEITATAGHSGSIRVIDDTEIKKKKTVARSHESMVDADLGKRTVGQEARTLNDTAKRVQTWLRTNDDGKWWFVINHTSPNIGGAGFSTPGGRKTKYLSIIRAWIRRKANDWPEGTGNFVAEIAFQKLKYGIKGKKAWVYFIPGYGVSREMTAVYECIQMGLAKKEATIKLNVMDPKDKEWKWMSQGRVSALAKKALEPKKHAKTFEPFFDALETYDAQT
jgi:RecA/RadA recombinase